LLKGRLCPVSVKVAESQGRTERLARETGTTVQVPGYVLLYKDLKNIEKGDSASQSESRLARETGTTSLWI
jgi:hypothetical protein